MGWYGDPEDKLEKVRNPNSKWRNIVPVRLNDCPRCGAKQENRMLACTYFGFKVGADGWAAYCRQCKATTAFFQTMEEAVEKWNGGEIT